jgi:type VI secretion system protein ImpH
MADIDTLLQPIPSDVRSYNFFQLVELLHKQRGFDSDGDEWEKNCALIFSANPSLGFSPSDVKAVEQLDDDRLMMLTNFFGLAGAQSPLPGFILQQLVEEDKGGFKRPFLDFFNNRLIALIYRIWRKYRYYVRFEAGAVDPFSQQLFALVGLADPELRGNDQGSACKMLAYSGLLAGRSRSPQVVSGIIAHSFDLEEVSIKQWQQRKVAIEPSQQFCLGKQNGRLGIDSVVGDSVMDCNGKFVISIGRLSRARFSDFLPSGREYPSLVKLVESVLREQMAYDLELTMDESEIPDLKLDSSQGVALGWYSFLGQSDEDKRVLIQVRQ